MARNRIGNGGERLFDFAEKAAAEAVFAGGYMHDSHIRVKTLERVEPKLVVGVKDVADQGLPTRTLQMLAEASMAERRRSRSASLPTRSAVA
jgi:hypothetical protein